MRGAVRLGPSIEGDSDAAFLQLVPLSVIIVGQNVLAAAADKRAEETYADADAVLHEAVMIQEHLLAQDKVLETLLSKAETR